MRGEGHTVFVDGHVVFHDVACKDDSLLGDRNRGDLFYPLLELCNGVASCCIHVVHVSLDRLYRQRQLVRHSFVFPRCVEVVERWKRWNGGMVEMIG